MATHIYDYRNDYSYLKLLTDMYFNRIALGNKQATKKRAK